MKLRTQMLTLVMPLLIAAVVATGGLASSAAAAGIVRVTIRLLMFKSEELSKQMYGQWDLLVRNGFAAEPEYLEASKLSIASFARSLVQNKTEVVFAIDDSGEVVLRTRPVNPDPEEYDELRRFQRMGTSGWIEFRLNNRRMVGEATPFEPFGWYVVIADERGSVFSEVGAAARSAGVVLLVTLALGGVLLVAISRHVTMPLQQVTQNIEQVIQSNEFFRPIESDRSDEIGYLARRFNYMASSLITAQRKLTDLATVATVSRNRAAAGEQETLDVLGRAAEYRDHETALHVLRVGHYSELLGKLLDLDERTVRVLLYAAPLHDVGKIGVPDAVLFKPSALTQDEFETIKSHTTIGHAILEGSRSEYLTAGATIALYHHEWMDGTGYPKGIAGPDIPLFARIVALADTFDAVTTDRPYKKARNADEAFALIAYESGSHFDPQIVDLFLSNIDSVLRIMSSRPSQR